MVLSYGIKYLYQEGVVEWRAVLTNANGFSGRGSSVLLSVEQAARARARARGIR